ncbi:TraR/DksA family transcriptional regulator [Streptomyces sp. SDT5-1]|uniref:TraR/DksA family transcriptional regulator n=1 Tax=Streptomyces sp. SDT5-1 TaxID=3406418 RepID=UPI003FCF32CC
MNHQSATADHADHAAHLTPQDLAALRDSLQEQQRFRRDQLRQIAAATATTSTTGSGGATAAQEEIQHTLAACARMVLADVEAALERLATGSYGRCHRCELPIHPDRLTIVPQARYCTGCHSTPSTPQLAR